MPLLLTRRWQTGLHQYEHGRQIPKCSQVSPLHSESDCNEAVSPSFTVFDGYHFLELRRAAKEQAK